MVCRACRYGMALAVQFSMIISVMECSTWNKAVRARVTHAALRLPHGISHSQAKIPRKSDRSTCVFP